MPRNHLNIKLNQSELNRLQNFLSEMARKKKWHTRLRGNVLWQSFKQDLTVEQIARNLNRSTRTIYSWLRHYKEKGIAGLYNKPRARRLTPEQIDQIMQVGHRATANDFKIQWSYRKIADWVKDNLGITISPERIRQIIRRKLLDDRKR